jgi:hypothetical protein
MRDAELIMTAISSASSSRLGFLGKVKMVDGEGER